MARKLHLPASGRPSADINITPLVDVVLVLLIIFMVVTPLLEKDIAVRVPTTEQVEEKSEVPPDQLVVFVEASSELQINQQRVPRHEYIDRLRSMLSSKAPSDKVVFVVAEEATPYGTLMNVIDGAKQAGAETIGMATELPADLASAQPAAPPAPPAPAPPP
jgi:biopolymer transport protein TolR